MGDIEDSDDDDIEGDGDDDDIEDDGDDDDIEDDGDDDGQMGGLGGCHDRALLFSF